MSESQSSQNSKKNRGPNFSASEKSALMDLVEKYKYIIANKKTDAVTLAEKQSAWQKLTADFNATSSFCPRSCEQLKSCWDNMKRNVRKDKANLKKEIFLTGGGKSKLPTNEPLNSRVESLMGPTVEGLQNVFDSDANFQQAEVIPENAIPITDWSTWTPAALRQQITEPLRPGPSTATTHFVEDTVERCVALDSEITNEPTMQPSESIIPQMEPNLADRHESVAPATPVCSRDWTRRRRPKPSLMDNLLRAKIELIETLKKQAEQEAIKKNMILDVQLRQEKIKAEILEIELKKKKES